MKLNYIKKKLNFLFITIQITFQIVCVYIYIENFAKSMGLNILLLERSFNSLTKIM
jgi:hypothetical protein